MAIPKFFRSYIKRHLALQHYRLLTTDHGDVSSLSIDMNSLLHIVSQLVYAYGDLDKIKGTDKYPKAPKKAERMRLRREQVKTMKKAALEEEYFFAVREKIKYLVARAQPTDTIVFAVDGPAPAAKISQQRQRRYKTQTDPDPDKKFETTSITPGTEFMKRLDDNLREFIDTMKGKSKKRRGRGVGEELPVIWTQKIIYSSHLVPGEGEHKIMDLMRAGEYVQGGGQHLIYGADADLIMLSSLSPLSDVVIMREDQESEITINENYTGDIEYVHIDEFKAIISDLMGGNQTAINDFVLITYFFGNDFLPKSPCFKDAKLSIKVLMDTYNKINLPLTTPSDDEGGSQIIWENFRSYLIQLEKSEKLLLDIVAGDPYSTGENINRLSIFQNSVTDVGNRKKFDFMQGRSDWYENALGAKKLDDSEDLIYKLTQKHLYSTITEEQLVKMVIDYLVGFSWVYQYYTHGVYGIDQFWMYEYYHTPLLSNISTVVMQIAPDDIRQQADVVYPIIQSTGESTLGQNVSDTDFQPIHVIFQMLAIIPPTLQDLLPEEIRPLMNQNSNISDMYPESFQRDKGGTSKDEENDGIALLPFVNFLRIANAVNDLNLDLDFFKEYARHTNTIYESNEELGLNIRLQNRIQALTRMTSTNQRLRPSFISNRSFSNTSSNRNLGGKEEVTEQSTGTRGRSEGGTRGRGAGGRGTRGRGEGQTRGRGRGEGGTRGRGRGEGGRETRGREEANTQGTGTRGTRGTRGTKGTGTRYNVSELANIQIPSSFGIKR